MKNRLATWQNIVIGKGTKKKNQNINLSVHEDLIPANEPYFHQVKAPAHSQMCHSYALGRTFLRFSASFSFLPMENPLNFFPSRNPDRTNGHATRDFKGTPALGFAPFSTPFGARLMACRGDSWNYPPTSGGTIII